MNGILKKFENKRVLILGFGREGQSTYKFFNKYKIGASLAVADQKDSKDWDEKATKLIKKGKNVNIVTGPKYLEKLLDFQIVFKSPGIPNKLMEIKEAKKHGVEFTSQTKLFFDLCDGTIIGITGTKGKSTTTTLIHHILTYSGLKSVILGNIGQPCLDFLDMDFGKGKYFCFELSSHQLSDIRKSPHIAVLLNIYKEHLDYYENFKDYINAKANITRYQKRRDYFIYNNDFPKLRMIALDTKATKISFASKDNSNQINTRLVGKHNLNNISASFLVAEILGISKSKIVNAVENFKPLEHRLQTIAQKGGVTFIDDSLATIPEATAVAIESFPEKVGSIILGGLDRGRENYEVLAKAIKVGKIGAVTLFPNSGEKMWKAILKVYQGKNLPLHIFTRSMKEAVEFCYKNTPNGKICLLSTAAPSFGVFRDYEDKAESFKKAVLEL